MDAGTAGIPLALQNLLATLSPDERMAMLGWMQQQQAAPPQFTPPARPYVPTPRPAPDHTQAMPPDMGVQAPPSEPNQVDQWHGPNTEGAGLALLQLMLSRR